MELAACVQYAATPTGAGFGIAGGAATVVAAGRPEGRHRRHHPRRGRAGTGLRCRLEWLGAAAIRCDVLLGPAARGAGARGAGVAAANP